jgi:hypothetical protein
VRVAPNGEITSAGLDAPPSDRLGGGVFTIRTDVPGQPENRVTAFGGRRN